jgi:hypothetical protein
VDEFDLSTEYGETPTDRWHKDKSTQNVASHFSWERDDMSPPLYPEWRKSRRNRWNSKWLDNWPGGHVTWTPPEPTKIPGEVLTDVNNLIEMIERLNTGGFDKMAVAMDGIIARQSQLNI